MIVIIDDILILIAATVAEARNDADRQAKLLEAASGEKGSVEASLNERIAQLDEDKREMGERIEVEREQERERKRERERAGQRRSICIFRRPTPTSELPKSSRTRRAAPHEKRLRS